jgi:hypothetical protein
VNISFLSNTLVVLADSHNPSILRESFLVKSKMIRSVGEIKQDSQFLTPAISQVQLTDGCQITLDQSRLVITSQLGPYPYAKGNSYCAELKYINGTAIGINFDVTINEYNVKKWFAQFDKGDAGCIEIKLKLENCNVVVTMVDENSAKLLFNFHYDTRHPLGDLKIDLEKEWEKNHVIAKEFLSKTF